MEGTMIIRDYIPFMSMMIPTLIILLAAAGSLLY
jgi:hypothetical protein